jgi:hypothetical protein
MGMKSHIANLLAAFALIAGVAFADDPPPDAHAILRTVRIAEVAQNRTLNGTIRTGGSKLPFRLVSTGNTIRYEFINPPQILQVTLGDKDVRLEEITPGKVEKVSPRRFSERVRDTQITYEDLSLSFLYWPNATVQGSETVLMQNCWVVRVHPPHGDTQYGTVDLWISKKTGALMQAQAYDPAGKLLRKFKVISGQPIGDGLWILKEMHIESFTGRQEDKTPTYMDIEKPQN